MTADIGFALVLTVVEPAKRLISWILSGPSSKPFFYHLLIQHTVCAFSINTAKTAEKQKIEIPGTWEHKREEDHL